MTKKSKSADTAVEPQFKPNVRRDGKAAVTLGYTPKEANTSKAQVVVVKPPPKKP